MCDVETWSLQWINTENGLNNEVGDMLTKDLNIYRFMESDDVDVYICILIFLYVLKPVWRLDLLL